MEQKSNESRPVAKAYYEDGFTETWTASPGVKISKEALGEFVRICLLHGSENNGHPASVEVFDVPVSNPGPTDM